MKANGQRPCSLACWGVPNPGRLTALTMSLVLVSCGGDDGGEATSDDDSFESSLPAPQGISIKRAARVGDRYHFEGEGQSRQSVEMSAEGKPSPERSRSEEFSVQLLADVEVLAINESNQASKVIILVKTLTRADDDGAPVTLLENAVVDAASEAGGVVYSIAGLALEEKAQQAIKLFTLLNGKNSKADEDAIFGTNESHAPGEEWSVDKAAVADFFSEETGIELVPDSIEGSMKFKEIAVVGDVPCQLLAGQVSTDMASFPGIPEGAALSDSKVEISLSGAFPTDPALPVAEKTMTKKIAPTLAYTTNGITVEMKTTVERTVTSRKTPRK